MAQPKFGKIVKGIYYKKEDEKNKLRMGNGSWSINLDDLEGTGWQGACFDTHLGRYAIDRETAWEKGWILELGGEKKLIVPCKLWGFKSY